MYTYRGTGQGQRWAGVKDAKCSKFLAEPSEIGIYLVQQEVLECASLSRHKSWRRRSRDGEKSGAEDGVDCNRIFLRFPAESRGRFGSPLARRSGSSRLVLGNIYAFRSVHPIHPFPPLLSFSDLFLWVSVFFILFQGPGGGGTDIGRREATVSETFALERRSGRRPRLFRMKSPRLPLPFRPFPSSSHDLRFKNSVFALISWNVYCFQLSIHVPWWMMLHCYLYIVIVSNEWSEKCPELPRQNLSCPKFPSAPPAFSAGRWLSPAGDWSSFSTEPRILYNSNITMPDRK